MFIFLNKLKWIRKLNYRFYRAKLFHIRVYIRIYVWEVINTKQNGFKMIKYSGWHIRRRISYLTAIPWTCLQKVIHIFNTFPVKSQFHVCTNISNRTNRIIAFAVLWKDVEYSSHWGTPPHSGASPPTLTLNHSEQPSKIICFLQLLKDLHIYPRTQRHKDTEIFRFTSKYNISIILFYTVTSQLYRNLNSV